MQVVWLLECISLLSLQVFFCLVLLCWLVFCHAAELATEHACFNFTDQGTSKHCFAASFAVHCMYGCAYMYLP